MNTQIKSVILDYINEFKRKDYDNNPNVKEFKVDILSIGAIESGHVEGTNDLRFDVQYTFKLSCIYRGEYWEKTYNYGTVYCKIGYTTKSGYFSKKKVDVDFEYRQKSEHDEVIELNKEQVEALLYFVNKGAKENTFDPFWHEKNAQSRNAAGWNFLASRLTDETR